MFTAILEPGEAIQDQPLLASSHVIRCVFLTASEAEFRAAAGMLDSARIALHHAATLEQAEFQLARTGARVLLTELTFPEGSWEDALDMLSDSHPHVALVVAALHADEGLWITALERGAFDVVAKPFQAEELRRILENANAISHSLAPQRATASLERPLSRASGSGRN